MFENFPISTSVGVLTAAAVFVWLAIGVAKKLRCQSPNQNSQKWHDPSRFLDG